MGKMHQKCKFPNRRDRDGCFQFQFIVIQTHTSELKHLATTHHSGNQEVGWSGQMLLLEEENHFHIQDKANHI